MAAQPDIEDLTQNIIKLSKKERLEIARFILFLDNRSLDSGIEAEWENEIIKRADAVEKGTVVGVDFFKAMKEIEQRFIP